MKYTLYIGIFVLGIFFLWLLFTFTLTQMDIQTPGFGEKAEKLLSISPVNPAEIGTKLTDTIVYTFDSSTLEEWAFFDFSRGSIVSDVSSFKDTKGWDLAFRRAKIASNGGGTNKNGIVEVARLKTIDFDSVTSVPEDTNFIKDATRRSVGADPKNVSLDKWYSYNFFDHNLKSYKNVLIIKTAEGNYAKMQIINYYCKKGEEKLAGCYTIKYVYQGDGRKSFVKDVREPLNQQVKKTG